MTTTGAPSGRYVSSAVWTGTQMVVWGGLNSSPVNTGGRYKPYTDTWTATTASGAQARVITKPPFGTGTEVILWGGL